tara:strand:- start:3029 stop:3208 length:180 start_codon:yes stop_codon:yes gene_type:complete
MSGQARNDWMKKQSAPENKEVIVVKTDTVSCSDDHPLVYYKLKNGRAECNYCGKVYVNE